MWKVHLEKKLPIVWGISNACRVENLNLYNNFFVRVCFRRQLERASLSRVSGSAETLFLTCLAWSGPVVIICQDLSNSA